MAKAANNSAASTAPPDPPAAARRPRAAPPAVIPEALSLGFAVLTLLGIGVVTFAADRSLSNAARSGFLADAQRTTGLLAVAAADADESGRARLMQHALTIPGLRRLVRSGPDATRNFAWDRLQGAVPVGELVADAGAHAFTAPIQDARGQLVGELRAAFADPGTDGGRGWLYTLAAGAAVVLLGLFLALHRGVQQRLRPLTAIARGLGDYTGGVERNLTTLSLSDSWGQVAGSWNQLIRELSSLQDQVGQRVNADAALTRFEARALRLTLDRLPFGIVRFANDHNVRYVNAAALRLLGLAADRPVLNEPLERVLGEEAAAPLLGALQRGAATAAVDRTIDDGQKRALRLELIPNAGGAGGVDALVVVQDVTHVLEAEQARDNFLYHVTHELRTPLTNIQAYAETLSRLAADDEQTRRECYNVIISETNRLSKLIEDVLSISQLEVGSMRVEWGEVDLLRLLRQMVKDNLGAAEEKGIQMTLKVPPKVPTLRADKQRIAVLINNLIGNAIKYTPAEGRVEVRLDADERCVRVAVADSGLGIAPEDQARVFEKFYRVASDDVQAIKGTGLGLAIAREVARMHGGDITLESTLGQGSTFRVELPLNERVSA